MCQNVKTNIACLLISAVGTLCSPMASGESTTFVDESSITLEDTLAPQPQCLDLLKPLTDTTALPASMVNRDRLRVWSGIEDWQFMTNPWLLAIAPAEEVEYGTSEARPSLRQTLEPSHKGSIRVVGKASLPPSRTYTLTQSFFLEADFDWGGRHEGGKIGFGLGGGSTPTGGQLYQDGFSARLMWRGNKDGTARMALYAYSSDRHQNMPYGDDYPLQDFVIPVDEWFTVTMELTSNSNTGASDGRVRIWVDDVLKLQRDGIHWQAAGGQPLVDHLMYATFHGGNSRDWSPDQAVHARFRDVCWLASTYQAPHFDENGILMEAGLDLLTPLKTSEETVTGDVVPGLVVGQ